MIQTQIIFSCDWRNTLIGTKIYTDSSENKIQTIQDIKERFDNDYPEHILVSFIETKWKQRFCNKDHLLNWIKILKDKQ